MVVVTDGPIAPVYALAVIATIAMTPYPAAHSALLAELDRSLTVHQRELDALQRVPMLRALTVASIEHLGRRLHTRIAGPGEVIVAEGTAAGSYYVVVDGAVEVCEGDRRTRTPGPGCGFGEVALLWDVDRTATVTATSHGPVELLRIDRDDFVRAVSALPSAMAEADAAINAVQP